MIPRRPSFPVRLAHADERNAPVAGKATSAVGKVAAPVQKAPLPSVLLRPMQSSAPARSSQDFGAVRARMASRLQAQGVDAQVVLAAMATVERHRFVDGALAEQAYEDTSLPIGLGQTISKPSVVARMVQLLMGAAIARSGGLGRVLEVGTGCGYQAAVLSRVAREVYSIERLRVLHEKARSNLRPFRLANLHLMLGDGMLGYSSGAPYAGIIAAAGGDGVPQAWCDQLAVGGRLVAPLVVANGRQVLLVVDKTLHGLEQQILEDVLFVPLKSGIA